MSERLDVFCQRHPHDYVSDRIEKRDHDCGDNIDDERFWSAMGGPAKEEEEEAGSSCIADALSTADVETLAGDTCEAAMLRDDVGRLITYRNVCRR